MPSKVVLQFVDRLGSFRTAVRERGGDPYDAETGAPISLPLADLAQDESGDLARAYETNPELVLEYLDSFCDLAAQLDREEAIVGELEENSETVTRTATHQVDRDRARKERDELAASLDAAKKSRLDEVAEWSSILTSQRSLVAQLETAIAQATMVPPRRPRIQLNVMAGSYGADLEKPPARTHVEGDQGVRRALGVLETEIDTARTAFAASVAAAASIATGRLNPWSDELAALEARLKAKEEVLAAQGLNVQAGEIKRIADRLAAVSAQLTQFAERAQQHRQALREREALLATLHDVRDRIYQLRRATMRRICKDANAASDGPQIHVYFRQHGQRQAWARWLASHFGFRSPRVDRIAAGITPWEFATELWKGSDALKGLEVDGERFAPDPSAIDDAWDEVATWDTRFELETWRLDDLPQIELEQAPGMERRPFDHTSAGQQRSILLSLMLFAGRDDPLVLDQPEDHLDAQYVASAVVRHLEAAKERRQVILATHSANLTVLGDAELVVPLYSDGRHGSPTDPGAVDRAATRQRVCDLLEGGPDAFRRRGERYGFRIESSPASG
jgi:hypothetical protein